MPCVLIVDGHEPVRAGLVAACCPARSRAHLISLFK